MSAPVSFRLNPDPDVALREQWDTDALRQLDQAATDRVWEQGEQAGSRAHGPAVLDALERHDAAAHRKWGAR